MGVALERISGRELYGRTGIQLVPINTVFQLAALVDARDPVLESAQTLLLVPDLLHYWLCGVVGTEFTNATTTSCLDPRAGEWATDVLDRLEIPARLFPELLGPGSLLGPLRDDVARETALHGARVVAPASHDTASAVAAVPFRRADAAYISAGTWSLVGVELSEPLIDDRTFAANLTNEGGVDGTFRLLRNVTGLWLLHECQRAWALGGNDWSYDELIAMADGAPALCSLVDPDDPSLAAPGDMPARIRAFCRRHGQDVPRTPGEVVRCALEGIALAHRRAIRLIREAAGVDPAEIHIVGGGARNRLLCQWTADATGLPVLAGPAEATSIGNLAVQALALGELGSLADVRAVARASFAPTAYEPRATDAWKEAYGRFEELTSGAGRSTQEVLSP